MDVAAAPRRAHHKPPASIKHRSHLLSSSMCSLGLQWLLTVPCRGGSEDCIPVGGPAALSGKTHEVFAEEGGQGIVAPHAPAAALLRKGAVKDVEGRVVPLAMLGVMHVLQEVLELQAHCVPIVVTANLH